MSLYVVKRKVYKVSYKDCWTHQEYVYKEINGDPIGTVQFDWNSIGPTEHKETIKLLLDAKEMLKF